MKKNYDFVIRSAKWQGVALAVFAALGFLIIVTGICVKLFVLDNLALMILLVCMGCFFLGIGVVGLYVYFTESFELKDGVFRYVKPFRKSQSAAVQDIAQVKIQSVRTPYIVDVVFYDMNGNKLINFYDDGTAFKGNFFLLALKGYNIPVSGVCAYI
ncbi:MAG: hypothetical protein K2G44_06825 [Clostridia bacterium]|nr:hypothetical protein [Clostridia bacterium]